MKLYILLIHENIHFKNYIDYDFNPVFTLYGFNSLGLLVIYKGHIVIRKKTDYNIHKNESIKLDG